MGNGKVKLGGLSFRMEVSYMENDWPSEGRAEAPLPPHFSGFDPHWDLMFFIYIYGKALCSSGSCFHLFYLLVRSSY